MANTILAKMAVEIVANTAQFNRGLEKSAVATKNLEKRLDSISNSIKGFGLTLLAGFGATEVIGGVLRVTAEFQKFEAVLTNTLGDKSRAQSALQSIRDFAVRTPFEVSELTAAFVRWTNQGLNPTTSTLEKLGDVASSLGAGFEQTAEAFKDLAVGQTRRIEEIGISATQANGKIQLSFKGVNIEVEKNAQGVQKALDVYSQLPGVIGATDAVSKTLAGSLSNLKDAWDNFLLTIGNSSNVFTGAIKGLTNLLTGLANFDAELEIRQKSANSIVGKVAEAIGSTGAGQFSEFSKGTAEYILRSGKTESGKNIADIVSGIEKSNNRNRTAKEILEDRNELQKLFQKELAKEGENIAQINSLWAVYIANVQKRYQEEYIGIATNNAAAAKAAKNTLDAIKAEELAEKQKNAEKEAAKAAEAAANRKRQIEDIKNAYERAGLLDLLNEKAQEISKFDLLNTDELDILKEASKEVDKLREKWEKLSQIKPINIASISDPFERARQTIEEQAKKQEAGLKFREEFAVAYPDVFKNINAGIEQYKKNLNDTRNANAKFQEEVIKLNEEFEKAAEGGLQSFFVGLGDVAAGQISFGDNVLKALYGFMEQFGSALIAIGIGKLGLDNLFKSGPAGAAAAIAAGTALVIAAGAVKRSMARKAEGIGRGGSGGGGSGYSGQTVTASGMQSNIQISGTLTGSGRDLVAVINNTSFDNKVRKGG